MSKTPFMPLWVSDFLGDTLDLDATEIGAYMLLLMAQWNRDGNSLPNDSKKLQRVARCGRKWPQVWASIGRYFSEDECGIYSKRLRLESQNVAAKRDVNARNGALGGKAKALKSNDADIANATNSPQRNPSIPEPYPEREEGVTKVTLGDLPSKHEGFDAFWEIFPNKVAKQNAKKAWAKLIIEDKRAAYAAVKGGWFNEWQSMHPQASPLHPATFLNSKRWEDQPSQPSFTAIPGGQGNEQTPSKSDKRMEAFLAGAKRAGRRF